MDHAAMGHGGAFAEGTPRTLLQLRVRERIAFRLSIPERLSTIAPIDIAHAVERPLRLGFAKGRWRINDRVFAMGETPIEVKRDTVETWLIRNYFNSMPHAMHLHGFHFQVLERQTSPDQIAALKVDDRGRLATDLGWKDTVMVWPGESVRDRDRLHDAVPRRADLHVPLPQSRARGRRHDARRQSGVDAKPIAKLRAFAFRRAGASPALEQARVKPEMVLDEGGDEKVAVVVAFAHPQIELHIALRADLLKQPGLELLVEKRVLGPLVDQ